MIPELGQYSLILALSLSVLLSVVPLVGAYTSNSLWMGFARPLSKALFLFLLISMMCLGYAFLTDDFSVAYVAGNSNSALPVYYKFSAIWGGHEGSLLLWVFILSAWTYAVAVKSSELPLDIVARVLSVMGMISVGFTSFTLMTSSPFTRLLTNTPLEGGDLNPLLQDIGLIIHPPMLYMGYVGFSVAFAFAIAALMSGRLDAAWARWSRPWTNVAWAFLTFGIVLGSWWAYYELGWGGWWFWDPVENASFMPWLVGTALVHSLAATEKRGVFKSWTVLLAIFAFSLSLLGTFLVRSGVLTSVHAFASDPERGFFVLVLLSITVGGSFLLYAIKAAHVKSESSFELVSRESFLLINNIMLVIVCMMVLLGTLYPLIIDAMSLGKISVGPPYFNALFVPLVAVMVVFMGIGSIARWKKTEPNYLLKQLGIPAVAAISLGCAFPLIYAGTFELKTALGMVLAFWVVIAVVRDLFNKIRNKRTVSAGFKGLSRSYIAMVLAHAGVAVSIVGVALVSVYNEERDLRMAPGDTLVFENFTFVFEGSKSVEGPNYTSDMGVLTVLKNDQQHSVMYPEKRLYTARGNVMTEADIDPGLFGDLYVAMGEPLEGDAWAIRVQYKPFVRWIWLGGLMMALGGVLAASDPRYRKQLARKPTKNKSLSPESVAA
ncbi:heme lyase CcmF/NrfE family subunit [Neptunomonas japonica]|uniref:heme lyase CcmF/NrfE family subunit n=1 Tax=Neptunomonas japonica TaxID=417574 RepID=UPI0004260F67|nr:heme lyase CcmF/NrfE family subunit [Neptunomonas japonica]